MTALGKDKSVEETNGMSTTISWPYTYVTVYLGSRESKGVCCESMQRRAPLKDYYHRRQWHTRISQIIQAEMSARLHRCKVSADWPQSVRFEVLKPAIMNTTVFWDVAPWWWRRKHVWDISHFVVDHTVLHNKVSLFHTEHISQQLCYNSNTVYNSRLTGHSVDHTLILYSSTPRSRKCLLPFSFPDEVS
jgi:hypothetical protein